MRSDSIASPFASAADLAECRALLCGGSRTFFAASLVLPARVRRAATGLYAFCRMADDAVDLGANRAAALADLRGRLQRIYAGAPDEIAADRAFADVVREYQIPIAYPEALLEGFEWDALNRRYQTLTELNAYAVRVAGVVGAMMAMVMGVRDAKLVARACDLGVAMQLTNIARDVGEDARNGRVYLPLQWLDEAGVEPQALGSSPVFDESLGRVVSRLLSEAESLYSRSEAGLAKLPLACRPGMYAARLLYAEIGHELARRKLDSVNHRAVVQWHRKARLIGGAVYAATVQRAPERCEEVLAEAGYLLESLPESPMAMPKPRRARTPGIGERVVWVVDLFERLERLERPERGVLKT
jgi:phytoene synthase